MESEEKPTKSKSAIGRLGLTWSGVISAVALVLSLISFVASHRLAQRSAIVGIRPVLVFEYSREEGWSLRNVGNGPALDVVIQHRWSGGNWIRPVRIPPIAPGGSFMPAWTGHANLRGLGASYADIEGRSYSSTTENDLTSIHAGDQLPQWDESAIGEHWLEPPLVR